MSKENKKRTGTIKRIAGPLIVAEGLKGVKMNEVVRVGKEKLIGEVVELSSDGVAIQVYEETAGIKPGEPVTPTGAPLSVELGPGLISSIYDGIQRPLDVVKEKTGDFIERGVEIYGLDQKKKWEFSPKVKKGDKVSAGDIIGEVEETPIINHRIMVPPDVEGEVKKIEDGKFTVSDTVAVIKGESKDYEISMNQNWPVRQRRPYKNKIPPNEPLVSGQRVIDTFFPIVKGGVACIPGPFGSGKTVIQQQLAKWADADIIVYIGCGERGNEMTDVLREFPELEDPYSGEPLIKRTVLIANTSNMPVAAREASIYTGTTIAEYYRDMGYKVALMADSTSRWAEALREMSGRLEEMPGEEGYPAYLASRIAAFYERGGRMNCLGDREGSLSIIGAVSPPGGDLSDPVVKNTLRVVKVFWGLDDDLASQRHFPAIHWLNSYSLYVNNIEEYLTENVGENFSELRDKAISILQEEESLQEIVRLVGEESLSDRDRQVLDTAKMLREDFLQQHAFDDEETFTDIKNQYRMLKAIMVYHEAALKVLEQEKEFEDIVNLDVKKEIAKMKYIQKEDIEKFDQLEKNIREQLESGGVAEEDEFSEKESEQEAYEENDEETQEKKEE
ncbi:MAG: V-type ATP synthase subunit A [Elusimicrobiota bacterium]